MPKMLLRVPRPRLYSPPNERPSQDLRRGPREVAGPEDGRAQEGERHPHRPRQAEEGPESEQGEHPRPASRPARLRDDGEGLRHAPRRPQVRPGEGEPDPQPMPDLALEDDRRAVRAAAQRARLAVAQVAPPPPL